VTPLHRRVFTFRLVGYAIIPEPDMRVTAMPDFPVTLAVYNFLPVALTGVALWYLARYVESQDALHHPLALAGGALILAGGLSKAAWKLIAAVSGIDLVWLSNALFPLMAPGFALLAAALWGATRRRPGRPPDPQAGRVAPRVLWSAALVAIVLAFTAAALRQWVFATPRGWFLPLLLLASLSNLAVSVLLIGTSMGLRRWSVAALFAVNLAMIFALQPIAMATPKTLALHWLEQSLTALGTGCFALAAFLLNRIARGGGRRRSSEPPVAGHASG
jgi:hypothetical protein